MPSPAAKRLCDFLDASPTAFHAVDSIAAALAAKGGVRLDERSAWELEPGLTYYLSRGGSGLIAFRVGLGLAAEQGFAIAGAHTDSPALKARVEKPLSGRGMERVAVEVYGGPILSTWIDRPLSLAGRVVVSRSDQGKGGSGPQGPATETRLVNLARPIGIVPNVAIHLNREINKGFEYNAHSHLPVLVASLPETARPGTEAAPASWALRLVAQELGVEADSILGCDLYFVDAQRATILGAEGELVNAYRLDDLLGCHAVLEAFLEAPPSLRSQVACFMDNEEVGSRTAQGADSSFLRDILGRICALSGCGNQDFYRALSASFCVSVDVAQAWHPSYADKYDEAFAPVLNGGPAVKSNANFKYATDAESEARFRLVCAEAGVPCQKFMSRADMSPGSTIGPMSAAHTGIATVDVGSPLLSMHSIRETGGLRDHDAMTAALTLLFR